MPKISPANGTTNGGRGGRPKFNQLVESPLTIYYRESGVAVGSSPNREMAVIFS